MLARLCEHDMSQRALSFPAAEKARASLGNRTHFLKRHVDGVLIKKALALWHKAQKEPHLVVQGRFMSEVIQTASLCISSTAIDEHMLVDLGVSQEQVDRLAAERPPPQHIFLMMPAPGSAETLTAGGEGRFAHANRRLGERRGRGTLGASTLRTWTGWTSLWLPAGFL